MTRLARLCRLLAQYEAERDPVRRFRLGALILAIGAPEELES